MRGIERVIAGILLVAAVCGSAAFARSAGREFAGDSDVQLTAAPPQHAQSSRGVQVPLYPLLARRPVSFNAGSSPASNGASKPSLADTPVLSGGPARRIVATRVARTPIRSRQAVLPAPRPKPIVRQPEQKAPAAPAPATPRQQSESRILAKVPLTPTPTWEHVKGVGHGKLKNHPDDDTAAPSQQQSGSGSLAPQSNQTITIVVLSPAPPPTASGDNGNGHGHAYGRLKQAFNDHD